MYKSFEINNFRCFKKLKIDSLERINLIAGKNNIGKTAFLEALFLHCGAYNPGLTFNVNALRGIEKIKIEFAGLDETIWDSFFYKYDTSKEISLVGENTYTDLRTLKLKILRQPNELREINLLREDTLNIDRQVKSSEGIQVLELKYQEKTHEAKYHLILSPEGKQNKPIPPPPPFPAFFMGGINRSKMSEDAERFKNMKINAKEKVLLNILKIIEPRIRDITTLFSADAPMFYCDIGLKHFIALPFLGDGMRRLTSLVLAIGNAQNGVVMIDEIENGLHYSILSDVWRVIREAAEEFNTQLFLTTHSLECVISAHKIFSESKNYNFRVHRLQHKNEDIIAESYDQETLEASIETELELR